MAPASTRVEFIVSPMLDMMNLMYFTSLVPQIEGVEGWPVRLRAEMAPDLLAELDALYTYPAGDPGIMGTLGDFLFLHPEAWRNIDALLAYIRGLPDGAGTDASPGIEGLIYQTTFRFLDEPERAPFQGMPLRLAVEARMRSLDDRDEVAIMALYNRPDELRTRMAALAERFYREHYANILPERARALEFSVASHQNETGDDPADLSRRLTGRSPSCLEVHCGLDHERFLFTPSMDMGPYNSCAVVGGIHGLIYPLEAQFIPGGRAEDDQQVRLARLFKALSDEGRLGIVRLLRGREMYANEIVEATGLHQSVVSRHLSFMKAVGLVTVRKQNNMKFYSINPRMRDEFEKTLDLFVPALSEGTPSRGR
ncbi:MAG TPA: metalloregulator ArsR/SmtB family transcription factor [Dehalococcoidia bacterium]|nr:metalloregulator ArsR/SmtB family transcription factor [Dehalococcoidia bacterium]